MFFRFTLGHQNSPQGTQGFTGASVQPCDLCGEWVQLSYLNRFLLAHVQQFVDFGNHGSLLVFHLDVERRLVFRKCVRLLTNVFELCIGQAELDTHHARAGKSRAGRRSK